MTASAGPTPPAPPTAARSTTKTWVGRVAALGVVVLFGWGSLLLAGWLRERDDLSRPVASPMTSERARFEAVVREPRLDPWLDPKVAWGPVRRTSFGRDAALMVTGSADDGPELVFDRLLMGVARSLGIEGLEQSLRAGPSATRAFRVNATVSAGPICASLVRLPLDAEASKGKTLKTEAGGVMLAFHAHKRSVKAWDYVTFYFPSGLDLSALMREGPPPPRVLALLGPEGQKFLVPTLSLGGEGAVKASKTVLCRAVGPTGEAIDRVADAMTARGWRDEEAGLARRTPGARVLTGPKGTVWMATTDVDRKDGLVSVLVEVP